MKGAGLMVLQAFLDRMPLAAILRGIRPDEAVPIGAALVEAGFRILEVPLNSPEPMASIRLLSERFGQDCLIGAGTVRSEADILSVAEAGGRLIVMPHADVVVIAAAKAAGMVCLPGVMTPTEAFAALDAGADGLKLFPAELASPGAMRAMRSVLPAGTRMLPVGGITPTNMREYAEAGAAGFGLGSGLYVAGRSVADTAQRARDYVAGWRAIAHERHAAQGPVAR